MKKLYLACILAAATAAHTSCGSDTPTTPPTPTPAPTPAPTPTPTPTATPTPAAQCTLPDLPFHSNCRSRSARFEPDVRAAVEEVVRVRPDLVNGGAVVSGKGDEFVQEVARVLRSYGYCAKQSTRVSDEVWVKRNTNDFSETWDVLTSRNTYWWGYAVTCEPAVF